MKKFITRRIKKSTAYMEDFFEFKKDVLNKKSNKKKKIAVFILGMVSLLAIIGIKTYTDINIGFQLPNFIEVKKVSQDDKENDKEIEKTVGIDDGIKHIEEVAKLKKREDILIVRELYENQDIVGFLGIVMEDVALFYAQGSDNYYYTKNDLYKKPSDTGAVFMDYRNSIIRDDLNTVIHSKDTSANSSFNFLSNYSKKAYFNNAKEIITKDLYYDSVWEVFSFYETSNDFKNIQTEFDTLDDFYVSLQKFKNNSIFKKDLELNKENRILTLTATDIDTGNILVLHAVLVSKKAVV